jgi:hypothetical protein
MYVSSYVFLWRYTGLLGRKAGHCGTGVIETIPSIFISSPLKADQTCVLVPFPVKHLLFRANPRFLLLDLLTVSHLSVLSPEILQLVMAKILEKDTV